jgi:hypothetical protein
MTAEKSALKSVIGQDGRTLGFLFRCAKGVKAFTAAEQPLGLFDTELSALNAINQQARGEQ